MNTIFETIKETGKSKSLNQNLPSVLIEGKSVITKNSTIKVFNKIIDQYGRINDFYGNRRIGINFFIETTSDKVLLLVKQLQHNNCLRDEKITDNRTVTNNNLPEQMLLVRLQVNGFSY